MKAAWKKLYLDLKAAQEKLDEPTEFEEILQEYADANSQPRGSVERRELDGVEVYDEQEGLIPKESPIPH